MSNFRSIYSGVDLDSIFAAKASGSTAPTTNFRNAGVDLNQRYEVYNGVNPSGPVGYRAPDGRDISLLFATSAGVPRNFSVSVDAQSNVVGGTATATVSFNTTGLITGTPNPTGSGTNTSWFTVPRDGLGNDYDVMLTVSTGAWSGSAVNTWHRLNATRSFSITRSTLGTNTGTATAQIRRVSDNVVVATGPVSVSATAGNPS